ncbi:sulfoxide reductase heme-binding subunit YedZ [Mesocricetibacter intestinalis]|uniref:Sulfoxide reductase heme-binding subunit YedZ n=1 Tax=Mesocricetibacter intestinalis TaxID=1521930 RepID=A0A4R6VE24_9PAST|nr:ferric reductase-like transmembrane domain-containing protein [Mesocricetibacter intestinalis]TDQ58994.1 sulfoxide reductase heme-binding subunit YedZ [Mesocricetibacter intestinalis]
MFAASFLRIVAHLCCFLPLVWLALVLYTGAENLGADPIKGIQHFLGFSGLTIFIALFLLRLVVALLKMPRLLALHSALGLWGIFYSLAHILSYFVLELNTDIELFLHELTERSYLIAGALSFLLFGITGLSTLSLLRRKIKTGWLSLHKLSYLALALAVFHYYLSLKGTEWMLVIYSALTLLMLGIIWYRKGFPLK